MPISFLLSKTVVVVVCSSIQGDSNLQYLPFCLPGCFFLLLLTFLFGCMFCIHLKCVHFFPTTLVFSGLIGWTHLTFVMSSKEYIWRKTKNILGWLPFLWSALVVFSLSYLMLSLFVLVASHQEAPPIFPVWSVVFSLLHKSHKGNKERVKSLV